jgi:O-antigen/teichoic acid export membrane protein
LELQNPILEVTAVAESGDRMTERGTPTVASGVVTAMPVALAGAATGVAGIIVTVLLARILSNQGYGAYAQLVSLFLIISMPGSALIVAVVRRTASWRTAGSHLELARWAHQVHRRMYGLFGVFALLVAALCIPLSWLLAKPSPVSVAFFMLGAGLWVLLCVDRGFLQGTQRYHGLAANYLVEGVARTIAILAFAAVLKLPGVALGVFVGELATAFHARRGANRALAETTGDGLGKAPPHVRRDIVLDLFTALAALALLALLQNVDVLILGHVNPRQAGSYAAVSIACKSLLLAAVVLGGYLLPEAAISHHEGEHALRQLAATLGIIAVPAVVLIALGEIIPAQIIKLVFGVRYLGAEAAFAPLAIAMALLSATFIVTMYLLAHGHRWVIALLAPGALVATIAIHAAHGAPTATAKADLWVQVGLCAATCLGLLFAHQQHRSTLFLRDAD